VCPQLLFQQCQLVPDPRNLVKVVLLQCVGHCPLEGLYFVAFLSHRFMLLFQQPIKG
jgi:hypothetical protein